MNADSLGLDQAAAAFAEAAMGGGLSPAVDALIVQAGLLRHEPAQALRLLEQARAAAPRHPVPLIALYRFYFYGHQLVEARAAGVDALAIARTALGPDFGDHPPTDDQARHDAAVRFYLFTLKGLAYLNLRLDERDEARLMLGELRRLDPQDHVGGALLGHVLARAEANPSGNGADPGMDTTDTADTDYPVRGWGDLSW